MADLRQALDAARLYLVCGAVEDQLLHAALRGGAQIVQLRLKDAGDDAIVGAGRRMLAACRKHDALLIVNDRPDLAVEIGADGVHVGQDDLPVGRARAIIGPNRLLGLSTHTPAQVDAASADPRVDYIGVGPVNATPTKPGRPAVGLKLVRHAAARARMPFFAIGGIDTGNAAAVVAAGARRIAVVRAITEAKDPESAGRALREALQDGARAALRGGVGAA